MDFKRFITEGYYNKVLHPRFWTDEDPSTARMEQSVQKKLLRIAKDFIKKLEIEDYVQDIQLTGSISNYNYTDYSDLDIHILLDFSDINSDVELVKSSLDGNRYIWNENHNIKIRGHDVEIYFQDIKEPHKASGLYSIMNDEWIRKPVYNPPEIDEHIILKKKTQIESDIKKYLIQVNKNKNDEKESKRLHLIGNRYKEKIYKMRKDSLKNNGEFGIGNLVFKQLRNSNAINALMKGSIKAYDNIFSEKLSFKNFEKENW